jgi:iron-sulfur cluster assembly accessory protein
MNLTLSDNAYLHIKNLLRENNKSYARLQVKGGKCAGFIYEWTFEDEPGSDDHLIDNMVLVHKMNELYLTGIEIDFKKELMGSNFTYLNPKAQSHCGCGISFAV